MGGKHAEKVPQLQTQVISYCKGKNSQREDLRAQTQGDHSAAGGGTRT